MSNDCGDILNSEYQNNKYVIIKIQFWDMKRQKKKKNN